MKRIILLLTLISITLTVNGQNKYNITGLIKDSSGQILIGANVWISSSGDTLHTITDERGSFNFNQFPTSNFSIKITILGYESYYKVYILPPNNFDIHLSNIFLRIKSNFLKEVIVKSKANPVTLKEDTIEYNISQYHLRESAQIEDLLKRMPGLEVDRTGNITFMGKPISKIKLNGKEFIVGNIRELLRLLPLEALQKVQIIDDYGRMSELTGRKNELPGKVLNLEINSDINTTQTLTTEIGSGSNNKYNINVLASDIGRKKQTIINGIANNTIPGAGESENKKGLLLYKNQLNDKIFAGGGISGDYSSHNEHAVSTIYNQTSSGLLISKNMNKLSNSYKTYNISNAFEFKDNRNNTLSIQFTAQRKEQTDENNTTSSQTGIQYVEQLITNKTKSISPYIYGSFAGAYHLKQEGELIAFSLYYMYDGNTLKQKIKNNSIYYNADNTIKKDSILSQLINKTNNVQTAILQSSYIKPIKENSSLEIKMELQSNKNTYKQRTQWNDKDGKLNPIDSLSDKFNYLRMDFKTGINFKKSSKKTDFIIGSDIYYGSYGGNHNYWVIPVFSFSYKFSSKSNLSLRYDGRPTYPTYQQIRVIPDRSNPLLPVIGNSTLKASTSNLITLDYRHISTSMILLSFSASKVFNQIVTNTILIRDSLNAAIQETRYLNTNSRFNFFCNYNWTRSFAEGKYQLFAGGDAINTQNIYYLNNVQNLSQNLTFTQSLRLGIYRKWIELNTGVGYTFNQTTYSNYQSPTTIVSTWNLSITTKFFTFKTWSLWADVAKQFNTGYANGVSANPTDLGATLEKTFLKNALTCRLQGFNLLDQNTGLSQTISGNTTTQTRTNQLGRFIMLSVILDLKKTKK